MWEFEPASQTQPTTVYVANKLMSRFAERYSMNYENEDANLTINNTRHCDSGIFRCNILTSNGILQTYEFLLIIVGKLATCSCIMQVYFLTRIVAIYTVTLFRDLLICSYL